MTRFINRQLWLTVIAVVVSSASATAQIVELHFTQKGGWLKPHGSDTYQLQFPDAPDYQLSFLPRERDVCQSSLARTRPGLLVNAPMPRFDASAQDCEKALGLARAWMQSLPVEGDTIRWVADHSGEFHAVSRILCVAGESQDARTLVEYCRHGHSYQRGIVRRFFPIAAYIENRLGALERGELSKLCNGPEGAMRSYAAVLLKAYGSTIGEDIIIEGLKDPRAAECDTGTLLSVMLDRPNPKVLAIVRDELNHGIATWGGSKKQRDAGTPHYYDQVYLPGDALAYLIAYGEEADWNLLSSIPLDPFRALQLISVIEDPNLLIPIVTTGQAGRLAALVVDDAHRLWTHEPRARRKFLDRASGLVFRKKFEDPAVAYPEDVRAVLARLYTQSALISRTSFISPLSSLSSFESRYSSTTAEAEWAPPEQKYVPVLLQRVVKRKAAQIDGWWHRAGVDATLSKLDHVSPATMQEIVQSLDVPQKVKSLLFASHQIADGSLTCIADRYRGPEIHRPYWFCIPGEGMLAGILSVTPTWDRETLSIVVSMDQRYHVQRTLIDAGPAASFPIAKLVKNHGSELITGARLIRPSGSVIPIELHGPNEGKFSGTTEMRKINGTYVAIDFETFGKSRTLTFDLFTHPLAVQARHR
jgi:hypothetical protein